MTAHPPIACDVHTHLIPVTEGKLASQPGVSWDASRHVLTVDGHAIGMAALFDSSRLIGWMDNQAVAHAFVSVPPPVYREHLDPESSRRWAEALNAGLLAIAAQHGDRLTALLHLPTHCPGVAADIATTAIATGHRHFAAPTGAPGVMIADPSFDPLWSALSQAGAFVFLHPGTCADGRLSSFYMSNLVGNPQETGLALASLVLGGVLARHDGLRLCLAHGGGSAPMLAGRLQRGYDTARPGVDTLLPRPQDLLRRVMVDCITHDEGAVALAEQVFGSGNVVFGSDWPFPMGLIEPSRQMAGWDKDRLHRICGCAAALIPAKREP